MLGVCEYVVLFPGLEGSCKHVTPARWSSFLYPKKGQRRGTGARSAGWTGGQNGDAFRKHGARILERIVLPLLLFVSRLIIKRHAVCAGLHLRFSAGIWFFCAQWSIEPLCRRHAGAGCESNSDAQEDQATAPARGCTPSTFIASPMVYAAQVCGP